MFYNKHHCYGHLSRPTVLWAGGVVDIKSTGHIVVTSIDDVQTSILSKLVQYW